MCLNLKGSWSLFSPIYLLIQYYWVKCVKNSQSRLALALGQYLCSSHTPIQIAHTGREPRFQSNLGPSQQNGSGWGAVSTPQVLDPSLQFRETEGGGFFSLPSKRLSQLVCYWEFPGFTKFGNMCPENYLYVPGPALLYIYYVDSGRWRAGVLFSRAVCVAVAFSC